MAACFMGEKCDKLIKTVSECVDEKHILMDAFGKAETETLCSVFYSSDHSAVRDKGF